MTKKTRKRDRKVIWYNPPYSKSVKTNVGAQFLKLIGKHFPRSHKLHKIFNRNSLKISYSCMKNMQQIIKAHNSKILKSDQSTNEKSCNCRSSSMISVLSGPNLTLELSTFDLLEKNKFFFSSTSGKSSKV